MDIKVLIQALARPWFIEESQASMYADMLHNAIYVDKRMDSILNQDNRNRYYETYQRVDANANPVSGGPVQLIRVEGALMKNNFCGGAGMESLQQAIRAANLDNTVLSIVLLIDSPGGTVDGTDNLAREIKNSTKPVVAFVNGMMCSAAYWIGSSADIIICDDANNGYNATIGSIGTMYMWKDTTKADEAAGVKTNIVKATKSTNKLAKYEEIKAGNYERLIKELDNLNETFLSAVQTNRGDKLNTSDAGVLSGETYDAKAALKVGLIDKIGSLPLAIKTSISLAKTIKK
jgi:signal peptide peptidase SppA